MPGTLYTPLRAFAVSSVVGAEGSEANSGNSIYIISPTSPT